MTAEARQGVAYGRLAEADAWRSLCDAPLRHQRMEHNQQIQIDRLNIHGMYATSFRKSI